jgi:uncharacterized protein YegL
MDFGNKMRRLPIYFLIDVSESMVGEPIEQVQEGIGGIIKELRTDPFALETVYVSIIVFAGKAQKITPLIELYNFYPPKLPIGGGTSLGNALIFLMNDFDSSLQKTTPEIKGDWKPIIFLFTDGNPTDKYESAFDKWNQKYQSKSNLVVISLGDNTDTSIFEKISEQVLLLKNTDAESFRKFFKWVTASIKTSSVSVTESKDEGLHLAPLTNDYLLKTDPGLGFKKKIDENFAVVLARCQTTKRHYLIKYQKRILQSEFNELGLNSGDYKLVGAYPIENTYFDLCDDDPNHNDISTSELIGFPSCPCCGNQFGFSHCSCGNIMCTGVEEISKCPWCGVEATFDFCEGSININRRKG